MERAKKMIVMTILLLMSSISPAYSRVEMIDIRVERARDDIIIIIETVTPVDYKLFSLRTPPRAVIDVIGSTFENAPIKIEIGKIATVSATQYSPDIVRIVATLAYPIEPMVSRRKNEILLHLRVGEGLMAEKKAIELAIEAVKEDARLRAYYANRERKEAAKIADREVMRKLEEIRKLLSEGKHHLEESKFTKASEKFKEVLSLDPDNRIALIYIARANDEVSISNHLTRAQWYLDEGRFHSAIAELRRIFKISPRHGAAENLIFAAQKALLSREMDMAEIETELARKGMMAAVERATQPALDYLTAPPPKRAIGELPEEIVKHKRELLGREVPEFSFENTPIRTALSFLSKASDVTIVLDEREIWALHKVTTFSVNPMPLSSALSILLSPMRWGYIIKEHYILITTEERIALGGKAPFHDGSGGGKVRRKIDKVIIEEFEFINADLREVLSFLAMKSGISIIMDNNLLIKATEEVIVGEKVVYGKTVKIIEKLTKTVGPPVTVSTVSPMPLSSALRVVLKPGGKNFAIEDYHVWVSTMEKIAGGEAGRRVTRFFKLNYPIHKEAIEAE